VVLKAPAARLVSPETALIFEQRSTHTDAQPPAPSWESWRLYESGRFVYARSGAEPVERRVDAERLSRVHAWLRRHDYELVRSSPAPQSAANESGVCQVRLSTGLTAASSGDPRYYACHELRSLSLAR